MCASPKNNEKSTLQPPKNTRNSTLHHFFRELRKPHSCGSTAMDTSKTEQLNATNTADLRRVKFSEHPTIIQQAEMPDPLSLANIAIVVDNPRLHQRLTPTPRRTVVVDRWASISDDSNPRRKPKIPVRQKSFDLDMGAS